MILVINIGNSNIRFGFFEDNQVLDSWTINTKPYKTKDELALLLQGMFASNVKMPKPEKIIIGSVVPHQTQILASALKNLLGLDATVVTNQTPSKVQHHSKQMGTDLYANAVAAQALYEGEKIIVDFGTALTLTTVNPSGEVTGVVIAPGVITSLKALVGDTAQLPDIELKAPNSVLGKDTQSCMQSGLIFGFLGMVEGLITRIEEEKKTNCFVISTGGLGHLFQPLSSKIDVDDKLHTLKGIYLLGS